MSGRIAFGELTKGFDPKRRARVEARKRTLRADMNRRKLRQARALARKAICETLRVERPAVEELERRTDLYVSNLRASIEAMGGRLNIAAEFPQGKAVITNFSEAGEVERIG